MKENGANKVIWTIGHSTHDLEEFIAMVQSCKIELVADIRSLPGSRKFPQFDKEALEMSLPEHGIQYTHLPDLGGRRKVKSDSKNTSWRHPAFRGYADYMETEKFSKALAHLEELALKQRISIMCAEAVWWRCHRSMVADQLKANGWTVNHIMGIDKVTEHTYREPARIVDGKLTYHPEIETPENKHKQK